MRVKQVFETETYGRYEIKSGSIGGTWGANAFRRKTLVTKASGASRDEAVVAVKAELDQLDQISLSDLDAEGAPSVAIYEQAFAALMPAFPESYVAMLRAHLAAPYQRMSATRLA